jgi:hypothetical protein
MNLSLESLHKFFEADTSHEKREFVVMIGQGGMEMLSLQIEKLNNIDYARFLHDRGILTSIQRDSLISMINSEDCENYTVAKTILNNKRDELAKMSPL